MRYNRSHPPIFDRCVRSDRFWYDVRTFGLRAGRNKILCFVHLADQGVTSSLVGNYPPPLTPVFGEIRAQARVARIVAKGFVPLSLAVSTVVRTSASALAAHMARYPFVTFRWMTQGRSFRSDVLLVGMRPTKAAVEGG